MGSNSAPAGVSLKRSPPCRSGSPVPQPPKPATRASQVPPGIRRMGSTGVAGRHRVAEVEGPALLVRAGVVAGEVGGQHDVRLLDDLVAVELERVEVEQERVLAGRRRREVPSLALEEAAVLEHDPEGRVAQDVHGGGGAAPCLDLPAGQAGRPDQGGERRGVRAAEPLDHADRDLGVLPGHEVRVGVVVHDRGVLVRARDRVDAEPPVLALGVEARRRRRRARPRRRRSCATPAAGRWSASPSTSSRRMEPSVTSRIVWPVRARPWASSG
jgi:hypothetical protein